MFLFHLLKTDPVAAIALILALASVLWCLRMLKRQHTRADRYLMALFGLVGVYQGLHILQNTGIYAFSTKLPGVSGAVDITVAAFSLVSIVILRMVSNESHQTRIQLRVVEANQPAAGPTRSFPRTRRGAIAVLGVDSEGHINLWHPSSEEFFGWRGEEALGTKLPFQQTIAAIHPTGELPQLLNLKTKSGQVVEALTWFMPIPGRDGSLLLVFDDRNAPEYKPILQQSARPALTRPEFTPAG